MTLMDALDDGQLIEYSVFFKTFEPVGSNTQEA